MKGKTNMPNQELKQRPVIFFHFKFIKNSDIIYQNNF